MNSDNLTLEKFICPVTTRITDAMSMIDSNGEQIVFGVDEKGRLVGSLTDGDVRRWIIRNGLLDSDISSIVFKDVSFMESGDDLEIARYEARKRFEHTDKRVIPIVDKDMVVVDLVIIRPRSINVQNSLLTDIPVIIMAGGKGTRLYPYTRVLPKPLIPMGDIPIIERIIDRFNRFGAKDFYLTVNYRKEMIKAYFNDADHSYLLHYVEEDIPLGTAGSIRLINKRFDSPVIVSNCDILINADYGEILEFHRNNSNIMTIVSSVKKIVIPYGVLNTIEGGEVTGIEEKPQMSYFINTGMYVLEPFVIDMIPPNSFFHMTDLTQKLIDGGMKIGTYPVSEESFLDMGELEEMKRMEEKLSLEREH